MLVTVELPQVPVVGVDERGVPLLRQHPSPVQSLPPIPPLQYSNASEMHALPPLGGCNCKEYAVG